MFCVFICRIFYMDLNRQEMKHRKHGMVGAKCINSFPTHVSPIEKSRVFRPWDYACPYDPSKRSKRDVVYLSWPIAPSYMNPTAGGRGVAGSQPMSTAVHMEPK